MSLYDRRQYRINKMLLCSIGQWPYQTRTTQGVCLFVMFAVTSTHFVAKMLGMARSLSDMDVVIGSLPPVLIDIISVIKLSNYIINADKMKMIIERMEEDGRMIVLKDELDILHEYAEGSRKFTLSYLGMVYAAGATFMVAPFLPQLIHPVANATNHVLPHNVYYCIDMDKYYVPILLHGYVNIIILVTAIVAVDTLFVVTVQHACGLFAVIAFKMAHMVDDKINVDLSPLLENDKPYHESVTYIKRHARALEFVDLIENAYSGSQFLQSGINMLIMSITGVQAVLGLDDLGECIRSVMLVFAQVLHLCFQSYYAQQLMDHSIQLLSSMTTMNWYKTSFRTRSVLKFALVRMQVPCVLTAGGFFVMSMETFSSILRTSMSYFTLLLSFQ